MPTTPFPDSYLFAGDAGRFRLPFSLILSLVFHGLILSASGHGFNFTNTVTTTGQPSGYRVLQATLTLPASPNEENLYRDNSITLQDTETSRSEIVSKSVNSPEATPIRASEKPDSKEGESRTRESAGVQTPIFEQEFAPVYPAFALVKRMRGSVTASFRVGDNGVPENIEILDSSSGGFEIAVIQALKNTRIKPDSVRPNSSMIVSVIFDFSGTNIQGSFATKR